jgi:NADPH:quinone reductase-like Zn-dependent oxidoreductase
MGRPTKYGSHQSYLVASDDMVLKVSSKFPVAHAATLTVVVMTAADVVYNLFRLPLPTNPGDLFGPLLIWNAFVSRWSLRRPVQAS